jgi:DivIVA domain-containing protein
MADQNGNDDARRKPVKDGNRTGQGTGTLSRHVPADIRDVSFHGSVRGYERHEVDRYVQRVNQLIAELEIARSPEAAVRHALDRVGEQTSRILQQARETADAIIDTARAESDEAVARAATESREIVESARTEAAAILADAGEEAHERVEQGERELAAARKRAEQEHTEADAAVAGARSRADDIVGNAQRRAAGIDEERRRVVEEVRELAARLEAIAESEAPTREETARQETAREAPTEVSDVSNRRRSPRAGESAPGA